MPAHCAFGTSQPNSLPLLGQASHDRRLGEDRHRAAGVRGVLLRLVELQLRLRVQPEERARPVQRASVHELGHQVAGVGRAVDLAHGHLAVLRRLLHP
eukprot:5123587-Alexandrium_andersonii.AAC.1